MNQTLCGHDDRVPTEGPGAAPSAAFLARCGRCGASFGARAWGDLALVERLDEQSQARFVVAPLGAAIQVRVCARCGGRIARTVRGA